MLEGGSVYMLVVDVIDSVEGGGRVLGYGGLLLVDGWLGYVG